MSDENGKLGLSPALKAIREQCRKPDDNRLAAMRNDWNGLRDFLTGGIRADGIWPAGCLSVRVDGGELFVRLSIHSLEIESLYRDCDWDDMWNRINRDLESKSVEWQLDWKGRERLERSVASS